MNGQQVASGCRGYVWLTLPQLDELVIEGAGKVHILDVEQEALWLSDSTSSDDGPPDKGMMTWLRRWKSTP